MDSSKELEKRLIDDASPLPELWKYVMQKHGNQKRKYTNEPYHTHLLNVAMKAAKYDTTDPHIFEVALCHDLLEDTDTTFDQFCVDLMEMGYHPFSAATIAAGVNHLTDFYTSAKFPSLNRKERKKREAERLGGIPAWCQSIKYADLIDNSESIADQDPDFARTYLPEKKFIVDKMRLGNIDLLIECCYVLVRSETRVMINSIRKHRHGTK